MFSQLIANSTCAQEKSLKLIVRDMKMRPLEGVFVTINETIQANTDAKGNATINDPGEITAVEAIKENMVMVSYIRRREGLQIMLKKAKNTAITGMLSLANGRPVSGVLVSVKKAKFDFQTATNAAGNFDLMYPLDAPLLGTTDFTIEDHKVQNIEWIAEGSKKTFRLIVKEISDFDRLGVPFEASFQQENGQPLADKEIKFGATTYQTNVRGSSRIVRRSHQDKFSIAGKTILSVKEQQGGVLVTVANELEIEEVMPTSLSSSSQQVPSGEVTKNPEGTLEALGYVSDTTVSLLERITDQIDKTSENLQQRKDEVDDAMNQIKQEIAFITEQIKETEDISAQEKQQYKTQITDLELQLNDMADSFLKKQKEAKSNITTLQQLFMNEKERLEAEAKKKAQEQAKLQEKLLYTTAVAVVFALVLLLAAFFAYRWKFKEKEAIQLARELNIQVEEKEAQRQLMEEVKEQLEVNVEELEIRDRKITDSLRYANTIQQAILPNQALLEEAYPELHVLYRPKDIVSGDFYWFKRWNERITYLAVVDCTGHGVPGSFMSMIGNTHLNEIINKRLAEEPSDILEMLDHRIFLSLNQAESGNSDGMDVCLCRIEYTREGQLFLSYAGAKRPLYYRTPYGGNIIQNISGDRRSIGGPKRIGKEKKPFTTKKIELEKGTELFLTTDGFVDQSGGGKRRKFGTKRFLEELVSLEGRSIQRQIDLLEERLDIYRSGQEQRDDITILGVKL
ncbi:hypothetical protein GCM10023331_21670 [Algivirga pacifica]|uniref:PPM-type phosphatase domain-containing protein n=2 Tax=Algivirga pacifica TaxID=1162670 RepID=A0ABP9DBG8_9BACT